MSLKPCRRCGTGRTGDSPSGLCPRCLLLLGLGDALSELGERTTGPVDAAKTIGPGVLDVLDASIGPVPRVLLRDTEQEAGPPPLVKPTSPEMPGGAGRPNRLQLFGEIARGGMGAVLKGRDPDLGRELAVKVLLESHRDKPDLIRRFVEEAQIGGQLQHPGVVPIYELGAFEDARPYFSMKLIKGRTLAALLSGRTTPADDQARFLGIFEQVAQTMAYAHARGVIHRDLKPTNIMVGAFGEVQVMDWGLAKVLETGGLPTRNGRPGAVGPRASCGHSRSGSDAEASQAGSVLGTPAYMPPEQAIGDLDAMDERADVFGLGAVLCEVLTGGPALCRAVLRRSSPQGGARRPEDAHARLTPAGPTLSCSRWPAGAWRPTRSTGHAMPGRWQPRWRCTRAACRSGCGRPSSPGWRRRRKQSRNGNAASSSSGWRRRCSPSSCSEGAAMHGNRGSDPGASPGPPAPSMMP